ncbi:ethanolamine utilization protein EutJ [Evansella sp. AB-rgal1]|uniref:ethanolamine utilization protein EutJ n=1 Tax=Evansella sp. AB-rgal1 TaxID=3242696 RepID=UPI00359CE6B6
MENIITANQTLARVNALANGNEQSLKQTSITKVGVDLGTSSIVLVVVDEDDQPLFAAFENANVVRDGLVVNYIEALQKTTKLKKLAESTLGIPLTCASGAIPPGTIGNNKKVVGNIIEGSGMELVSIVDEPTAAATVLNIQEGAVIDIGGGTTGISIFKDGEVVFSADEATGGTQMTLVLSGYLGVPTEEGEQIKRDKSKQEETFPILIPVVEKMASIVTSFLTAYGKPVQHIYLVGGATDFPQFASTFSKILGRPVIQPDFPQFVTPLGIAMISKQEELGAERRCI